MFLTLLPADTVRLKARITAAIVIVTPDMLKTVLSEFFYRMDVIRVSADGHIEPL